MEEVTKHGILDCQEVSHETLSSKISQIWISSVSTHFWNEPLSMHDEHWSLWTADRQLRKVIFF